VERPLPNASIPARKILCTFPSQLFRLLYPTNTFKSVGQSPALLYLVGREVDVAVNPAPVSSAG
jgi:hypothetical protein